MRPSSGRNVRARNSNGGEAGLWVPPSSASVDGPDAVSNAGSTVCSTSVVLQAVPTEKA